MVDWEDSVRNDNSGENEYYTEGHNGMPQVPTPESRDGPVLPPLSHPAALRLPCLQTRAAGGQKMREVRGRFRQVRDDAPVSDAIAGAAEPRPIAASHFHYQTNSAFTYHRGPVTFGVSALATSRRLVDRHGTIFMPAGYGIAAGSPASQDGGIDSP